MNILNLLFVYRFIGSFPNTYTFTKLLAEQIINEEAQKNDNNIPMVIFRPSIGKYYIMTCIRVKFKIYIMRFRDTASFTVTKGYCRSV